MDAFLAGFAALADPQILFLVFAGTMLGIVVGALPGISGSTTTALLLPLTIVMSPNAAIAFLGSIYCAANFGGSITAILINTPGDPSASATAFDGYPMARRGEARSEEHTSELQSRLHLVCRLLLEKKKEKNMSHIGIQYKSTAPARVYFLLCTLVSIWAS